jgi:hypothetical protein
MDDKQEAAGTPPARDERWFEQLAQRVNADTEMALVGRHLDATVSFTFGSHRHDLVLERGKVAQVRHGKGLDRRVDFGFRAPEEVWAKFFARPAPPLYNSVFAMAMRVPDFHLEGDTLVWAQNARSLTRLLEIMQLEGQPQ